MPFIVLPTKMNLWLKKLRGSRKVQDVPGVSDEDYTLKGVSHEGYEITISCSKKLLKRTYANRFIPTRTIASYRVSAHVTENAPVKLKEACKTELHLPVRFFGLFFDEVQRKRAIAAYLDLVASRLRRTPMPA